MNDYYSLLGIKIDASPAEIKKAFREKAKHLHPDITGQNSEEQMRRIITAYKVLSNPKRRFEYNRIYSKFFNKSGFNYRTWLRKQGKDPKNQSKLIFFELFHMNEDEAIKIWRENGGINFNMENHLPYSDWMDCIFILAEELEIRRCFFEAWKLYFSIIKEEQKYPFYKHFAVEIEKRLKNIVKRNLKEQVDELIWIECLQLMLSLNFPDSDKLKWMYFLAQTFYDINETEEAEKVIAESEKYGKIRKVKRQKVKN
jgi:curved DNA-binding protein CbpA